MEATLEGRGLQPKHLEVGVGTETVGFLSSDEEAVHPSNWGCHSQGYV